MENININKIHRDDSGDKNNKGGGENRRQLIYITILCFFGSVLCLAAFYYLYSEMLFGPGLFNYFPLSLFAIVGGSIFIGFCLICVGYGFLSGVYDLLG